jgi:membrane associated rhomboid family serine protease
VLGLIVLSGIFTWLIGISSPVVGASGLIYALTAYLITAGLHERQLISAATAVLVGVLYGGTLFWNLLPTAGKTVAWDAHLLGAAAGAVYAHLTLRKKPTKLRDIRPSDDRNLSPSTIVE